MKDRIVYAICIDSRKYGVNILKKALCIKAVPILLGMGIILIFAGLRGIKGMTGLTEKQRLSDFAE